MNILRNSVTSQRWRPNLSVRWRLTLWYLLILSVVMLVFGGVVYETQATDIRSQLNDELRRETDDLAASYDPSTGLFNLTKGAATTTLSTPAPTTAAPLTDQQLADLKKAGLLNGLPSADAGRQGTPMDVAAESSPTLDALGADGVALLINSDGKLLSHYGPLSDSEMGQLASQVVTVGPPRTGTTSFTETIIIDKGVSRSSEHYRFYTSPVLIKDTIVGTLVTGVPDRAPAQLHRLLATLLIAAPITLLIAVVGGYWLATRAMRPIRVIANTVRSIGATDLSQRLNLSTGDELGDLATTFDQMLDRLEAAFDRQRQFTSDASHELRTPLTIMQLELEHARAGKALTPEVARALETVQNENEYMSRLVNDLLTLARADTGRAVLKRERVDLSDVTLATVERLAPLARADGIVLTVGDLPALDVDGDPTYLAQMLTNVVANAIRYTSGFGQSVVIDVEEREIGGRPHGLVRVKDDGPGIAPQHLSRIFERFYRVDQARERLNETSDTVGSGLGLAIAQWVAQSHGGDVGVESEVGNGTTFEMWLPLADERQPEPAELHDDPVLVEVGVRIFFGPTRHP